MAINLKDLDNKVKAIANAMGDVVSQMNSKFEESGFQTQGLGDWMTKQLKNVEGKLRQHEIEMSVLDMSAAAIVKLLKDKGIITEEEFKNTAENIFKEAQDSKGQSNGEKNKGL